LPQRVRTIHEPPPAAKYGQSYENWLSKDSSTTQLLKDFIDDWPFWQNNKDKGTREAWQAGNSYVNHWSSPTTLIPVDDMGTHLGSRHQEPGYSSDHFCAWNALEFVPKSWNSLGIHS
jgi:hypothetical protein